MIRTWSIPVGKIFGVDLRLHLSYALLLLMCYTQAAAVNISGARGAAICAIIFGAVVLHETARVLMATYSGAHVRQLILLPTGGVTGLANPDEERFDGPREIRVAIAGIVSNLLAGAVAAGLIAAVAPEVNLLAMPYIHASHLLRSLVWINLCMGLLNVLPIYPLDGGRILRAMMAQVRPLHQATRSVVGISQGVSFVATLGGMITMNPWLMLLGFFLFIAAQLEDRGLTFQSVVENVKIEEVMLTEFSTLSPADTLEDALAKAVHSLQDDFPVVRGGDMVGVISKSNIIQALRAEGNGYVQSAMQRAFDVAQRQETLATAFRKIKSRGFTLLPIVDNERLVGIVTLQNLMHSMGLLAESRRLQR